MAFREIENPAGTPFSIVCRWCGALPSEFCRTARNKICDTHSTREIDWRRLRIGMPVGDGHGGPDPE